MSLENRIALVTGAGGGIGRAIAVALAKEKVSIALFGGNNLEKLNVTSEQIKALGGKCEIFAGDLTDDNVLKELYGKFKSKFGCLDIIINNAGMTLSSSVKETEMDVFDKIMRINVRTPYLLTKTALNDLLKSDRASVINVASVVAHAGYPLQSAYVASKHALLGFTKSLAAEVYSSGVRVHAISPGGVYTDMVKISRPDLTSDGMIMPEEIADIVMFLLKNRGNAVVDEILVHRVNKQPFLV